MAVLRASVRSTYPATQAVIVTSQVPVPRKGAVYCRPVRMWPISVFPDWQLFAVRQRNPYGCIATSYEMILRAAGAQGIDFATFQEDFDLDLGWRQGIEPRNNFGS